MIGADEEEGVIVVAVVLVECFAYHARPEDHGFPTGCRTGHLVNEVKVVLAWNVGDIDWSTADAASRSVKSRVVMNGLEHVPIWKEIQMLGE